MKRREFFGAMGVVTAATALPLSLLAEECGEELPVTNVIGNNHGHSLDLDIKKVLQLLRETNDSCPVELDIQGESGHPHSILLSHQNLLQLLVRGKIEEVSSNVAGHTHDVSIALAV